MRERQTAHNGHNSAAEHANFTSTAARGVSGTPHNRLEDRSGQLGRGRCQSCAKRTEPTPSVQALQCGASVTLTTATWKVAAVTTELSAQEAVEMAEA